MTVTKHGPDANNFFERAYIARKGYNEAKGHMQERINRILTKDWNLYFEAMEARVAQDKKEQQEQVTH